MPFILLTQGNTSVCDLMHLCVPFSTMPLFIYTDIALLHCVVLANKLVCGSLKKTRWVTHQRQSLTCGFTTISGLFFFLSEFAAICFFLNLKKGANNIAFIASLVVLMLRTAPVCVCTSSCFLTMPSHQHFDTSAHTHTNYHASQSGRALRIPPEKQLLIAAVHIL